MVRVAKPPRGESWGELMRKSITIPQRKRIIEVLVREALKGDFIAARTLMDRMDGKPAVSMHLSGEIAQPLVITRHTGPLSDVVEGEFVEAPDPSLLIEEPKPTRKAPTKRRNNYIKPIEQGETEMLKAKGFGKNIGLPGG